MRERVCKNCGGRNYIIVGQNMTKCAFCGTLYVDEHASKEEVVLIVGANEILRELRFEDALDEYNKILEVYPQSFEAYFGKALAKNKIVVYPNKRGVKSRPRFFDTIISLEEDEDFKKAISLAPEERAKEMQKLAARTAKIQKAYLQKSCSQNFDVIFCAAGYDNALESENVTKMQEILQKDGKNVYFLQDNASKECEEESFRALETSKLFVFATCLQQGYGDFKHLLDRYNLLIKLRKKPRTSFVLILDGVRQNQLPKFFTGVANVLNTNSATFLQDLQVLAEKEIANFSSGTAKINTIKLQNVAPKKKQYVDIESISPKELGAYNVETKNLSSQNKLKWIFLCLKNGDFETAQEEITQELNNNPYSSELLFASLMCQKQIKAQEEFFSSLSHFSDREKIDNILRYSSKQFAEFFVDTWEGLIQKMDNEEIYSVYLEYLTSFATPNRDNFIRCAENKAIETQYLPLIEKVEKCFDKTDVDRFVEFYYALAQKTEDDKYYNKILQLDAGHMQSNFALILQHFKTAKDKLSYRNAQEVENMLKFMNDTARVNFIEKIVELVLPVAFCDLQATQAQLDFYLAYLPDDASLARLCEKVSVAFKQMRFFKVAEKYISLAISKSERKAELYWQLIQIRAHCRSESELITSQVKISKMPEWETLLEYCDDMQDEAYGQIVSKSNLYKGERQAFLPDALDKKQLTEGINAFLLRNNKILQEFEKQNLNGAAYYMAQLQPFEKYVKQLNAAKDFDEFNEICKKINVRLAALDLNLDMSISALTLSNRFADGIKLPESNMQNQPTKDHKKFLKRYFCGFLEVFPLLFATFVLFACIVAPKSVYKVFSWKALFAFMIFSCAVGVANLTYIAIKGKSMGKVWKNVCLSLYSFGFLNVCLFLFGFYIPVVTISINSTAEMATLLKNVPHGSFVLAQDLDFKNEVWKSVDFSGRLDGNNHKITNIVLPWGGVFNENSGNILNLVIEVQEVKNAPAVFGVLANVNSGNIVNCTARGSVNVSASGSQVFGGLVGTNSGTVVGCQNFVDFNLKNAKNTSVGGLIGLQLENESHHSVSQNSVTCVLDIQGENCSIGGMIGKITSANLKFTESFASCNMNVVGQDCVVGGLVGSGDQPMWNCYATGAIVVEGENCKVGGLYGSYVNTADTLEKCYANVEITYTENFGTLFGTLGGRVYNCYSAFKGNVFAETLPYGGVDENTEASLDEGEFYNAKFEFDTDIWKILPDAYPILQWEEK